LAIDRAATLRNAEKLLRQGRVDAAIAEYVRVVEDNPRDWNTANVLGDLYVRVGKTDRAVEQFMRIADSLTEQGFLPKAAALYKKALKLKPDHEHAMLKAGEIAGQQGFYADARAQLGAVAARRRARGDARGAAEVRIRLGSLDPADFEARIAAAHARFDIEDVSGAVRDLVQIAGELADKQRYADAVNVLDGAATVLPSENGPVRERVYDLFLTIAGAWLRSGSVEEGLAAATRVLDGDPSRRAAVAAIARSIADRDPDAGLLVMELANRELVARGDWLAAAAALQEFAAGAPHHLPALMRLVEMCVDGGMDRELEDAQAQLAEAYLAAGQAPEARYIAEDLVERRPSEPAHVDRLRRTLVVLGEPDPEAIIAERIRAPLSASIMDLSGEDATVSQGSESPPPGVDASAATPSSEPAARPGPAGTIHLPQPPSEHGPQHSPQRGSDERETADEREPGHVPPHVLPPAPARRPADMFELSSNAVDIESILREFDSPPSMSGPAAAENGEVDLSVVLDDINRRPPGAVHGAVQRSRSPSPEPIHGSDIENVFAQFRGEASRRSAIDAAEQEFRRALALQAAGDIDGCIAALQSASKAPRLRFRTARLLGRLFRERGLISQAADWYERAAQAPAPTPDDYHGLLFELAEVLEEEGEIVRALAVCLELQADAGDYRDVAMRVDRLAKVQARG
jgi:tetratricopeptide (TPR) repeat protein